MPYDVDGALGAGASEDQVLGYLKSTTPNYDVDGALNAGASKRQVMDYLATSTPPKVSVPGMPGGQPPAPPKPPMPSGLTKPLTGYAKLSTDINTNRIQQSTEADKAPFRQIGQGVSDIKNAPTLDAAAKGASETYHGALGVAAKTLPFYAPLAPVATAVGLGLGTGVGAGVEKGATKLGASPGFASLAGDVAGTAAGGLAGKALLDRAQPISIIPRRNPKMALTQALKPTATNTKFTDSLDRSMPEIKASETEVGPIADAPQGKALDRLLDGITSAKKRIWGQYQQMAGPAANAQIDMSPVAEAMVQSIPQKFAMENPTAAAAIMNKAALYRKPMPLQQAEQFLKETNAELQGQYAKYPPDQRKALAANPQIAYREAQADALRGVINGYLDQPGGGAASSELKQRYGSLMNMEREVYRRKNVADRQQPDSLSEQFGKWSGYADMVRGALSGNPVDVAVGVSKRMAAKYIKEQQTTDALIRSAFRNYQGQSAPIQMPPPFQPKALLTRGDVITPPPPDSSFVRGVPAMPQPPTSTRALPPATTRITPPPDATDISPSTSSSPLVSPTGPGPGVPNVTSVAPKSRTDKLGEYYTRRKSRKP
jgi:hypothetical protein